MPKDFPRNQRVGDQIQRELAGLIRSEVKDPRLSVILTVAEVRVAPDLGHAKIYITVLDDKGEQSVEILNQAAGMLRAKLGRLLRIRSVPLLHFVYDTTTESAEQLSSLIDQALAADRNKSNN